jgi:hypothetical protein
VISVTRDDAVRYDAITEADEVLDGKAFTDPEAR